MARETAGSIGRYEIVRELGRGSMGRVYLARDPNIDRQVAVKVLARLRGVGREQQGELEQRFILEARAAGRINHPGIVTVYDAETDARSGRPFIAMEWVDGESLEQLLERGPLPAAELVRLGQELALALDAAHAAGLVHRDVKPANILLDRERHAKITDFGIAKFTSMANTASGRLLGSPFYMSPEQLRGEPVDGRSDLFSLGAVLYQAATGSVPFASDSLAGITYKILEIDPTPAALLVPALPSALSTVIARALEKDPDARFPSGRDFARALATPGEESPVATTDPTAAVGSGTLILAPESPAADNGPRELASSAALPEAESSPRRRLKLAGLSLLAIALLALVVVRSVDEPRPAAPALTPAASIAALPTGTRDPAAPQSAASGSQLLEVEAVAEPSTVAESGAPLPAAKDREHSATSSATVTIRYRNHLRYGRLTILVDDVELWSGAVGEGRGLLGRTVGNSVQRRVSVPPGKHVIAIHIEGAQGTVDARKRIWGTFVAGARHQLKVRLVPPHGLRLSWDD